jgi:hypothetical protein
VRSPWKSLGSALKWIGGITAVLSLVLAAVRVNDLFTGWQEKRMAVGELVRAAQFRKETQDHGGAWELLDQAISLEPASRAARREQIDLAVQWVRALNIQASDAFAEAVDRLIPVLYRGVVSEEPARAATISAHLGWADFLRVLHGEQRLHPELHFDRALQSDPANVYANAMYGHWLLRGRRGEEAEGEVVTKAAGHFETALQTGKERSYVRNLQISAYLDWGGVDGCLKAFDTAVSIRETGEEIRRFDRNRFKSALIRMVTSKDRNEQRSALPGKWDALLERFGPNGLMEIFTWSYPPDQEPAETGWWYVRGRLLEEAGNGAGALKLYRELTTRYPSEVNVHTKLARERIRELESRMGVCYVPVLVVRYLTGEAQAGLAPLKPGDILVSYGGDSIGDLEGLQAAKRRVDTENVEVMFLREGASVKVEVSPGTLGIVFDEETVSEKELAGYAAGLCGRK